MTNTSSKMENAMNALTEAQKEKLDYLINMDIEIKFQLAQDLDDTQALRNEQRQWRTEEVKERQLERKLRCVHLGLATAELALLAGIAWFVIT